MNEIHQMMMSEAIRYEKGLVKDWAMIVTTQSLSVHLPLQTVSQGPRLLLKPQP